MKFHIHVYRVDGLEEMDVDSETEEKARRAALLMMQSIPSQTIALPDCGFIAVIPRDEKVAV